jgi:mevalonate kinase
MTRVPAKLLIFGEYSILLGSSALSMPFRQLGASFDFNHHNATDLSSEATVSNNHLRRMCDYLSGRSSVFNKHLDLERFKADISKGLYLKSNIPQRYGVGSSGALCAAVFEEYRSDRKGSYLSKEVNSYQSLREIFMEMESFFHGRSSGFDPLVSFLNMPLVLDKNGEVVPASPLDQLFSDPGLQMVLIDSGQQCSTGPLVSAFLASFAPGRTISDAGHVLCSLVDAAIGKVLAGDVNGLWDEITGISRFQLTNMGHLIPGWLKPVWAEGLQAGMFAMKLCGSGGGGFLLCFTRNRSLADDYFKVGKITAFEVF